MFIANWFDYCVIWNNIKVKPEKDTKYFLKL